MPDHEPNAAARATTPPMIDETNEFSAPRFFDFMKDGSEDDKRQAELWFDAALPYAPSPFMPRINAGGSFTVESMCNLSEAEKMPKSSQTKNIKPSSVKRETNVKNAATGTPNLAQGNQPVMQQKLDGGRSREILNPKPQTLPHKSKLGHTNGSFQLSSSTATMQKEDRQVYVREPAAPCVSMAERMKRFQSSTRDLSTRHINGFLSQMKDKLTLTRPKEPEFETSQRVRSVRAKSPAELEEEMTAKIPKFKARPLNKKERGAEKERKFNTKVWEKQLEEERARVPKANLSREERDAARMVEEQKALKQLRRSLVPHARPMPNFEHAFCPQKCPKEPTNAKSPQLRVLERKEKRRMMINSAVSSAAVQMR